MVRRGIPARSKWAFRRVVDGVASFDSVHSRWRSLMKSIVAESRLLSTNSPCCTPCSFGKAIASNACSPPTVSVAAGPQGNLSHRALSDLALPLMRRTAWCLPASVVASGGGTRPRLEGEEILAAGARDVLEADSRGAHGRLLLVLERAALRILAAELGEHGLLLRREPVPQRISAVLVLAEGLRVRVQGDAVALPLLLRPMRLEHVDKQGVAVLLNHADLAALLVDRATHALRPSTPRLALQGVGSLVQGILSGRGELGIRLPVLIGHAASKAGGPGGVGHVAPAPKLLQELLLGLGVEAGCPAHYCTPPKRVRSVRSIFSMTTLGSVTAWHLLASVDRTSARVSAEETTGKSEVGSSSQAEGRGFDPRLPLQLSA